LARMIFMAVSSTNNLDHKIVPAGSLIRLQPTLPMLRLNRFIAILINASNGGG